MTQIIDELFQLFIKSKKLDPAAEMFPFAAFLRFTMIVNWRPVKYLGFSLQKDHMSALI